MSGGQTVFLVDDDDGLRVAVCASLRQAGLQVRDYASAAEFLADDSRGNHGCLVLDVRMPGMNGIELQQELIQRGITLPVLFITGYGDIDVSVRAMKRGAVDFLEKPVAPELLLSRIREALAQDQHKAAQQDHCRDAQHRFELLTARERQVVARVINGKTNKEISRELDISFRTVEKYRALAMSKLQVHSSAELCRLGIEAAIPLDNPAAPRDISGDHANGADSH